MLAAKADPHPGGGADHQRHMRLAARHEAQLRRVVDDLVHRHGDKVHQHDFGNWPKPGQRRTDAGADNRLFGNRRGPHAVRAIFGRQSVRDLEHPAALLVADIFAQQDHAVIFGHGLVNGAVQRLDHADLCGLHAAISSSNTSLRISSGPGTGLSIAKLTASSISASIAAPIASSSSWVNWCASISA